MLPANVNGKSSSIQMTDKWNESFRHPLCKLQADSRRLVHAHRSNELYVE